MITFKANFLKPVNIQRKSPDSNYLAYRVSLVELNPQSFNDYISLNKTNCKWGNCKTILHDITKIFNYFTFT